MTTPMRALKPDTHHRLLIAAMAAALADSDADLSDDRAAMRCLADHRFRRADVAALIDDAIDAARTLRAGTKRPSEKG